MVWIGSAGVPSYVAPGVDEGGEVGFAAAEGFHDSFGFFNFLETLCALYYMMLLMLLLL